ncbi:MAG: phosphate/phosphite/phosphonate ABC transporter substrate-binding protein [Pseudomonadota bacterium]
MPVTRTAITPAPLAATLAIAVACLAPPAAAQCGAPYLAPSFCDANGDMLADAPQNKQQWIDPDPLVVADVATSYMHTQAEHAQRFVRHLESALHRKVKYFVARDYTDLLAAYKAQRVHLLTINAGALEQAVRCDGFVPLVQAVGEQGEVVGYQMEFLVPKRSAITALGQLKGHTITFVDKHSASGFVLPYAILSSQFGMLAGRDFKADYSGRHDISVMGVAGGAYEAVAISSIVRQDLLRDKLFDPDSVRVIYTSGMIPYPPWGVSHRLQPQLAQRIAQAMVSFPGTISDRRGMRYRAANYRADWAAMRALGGAREGAPKCD